MTKYFQTLKPGSHQNINLDTTKYFSTLKHGSHHH